MKIFSKNKKYCFDDIVEICAKNNLTTIDCLNDENMISIEEYINGELGGECIFTFDKCRNNLFKLNWIDKVSLKNYSKKSNP
jgi:hypothetical protein